MAALTFWAMKTLNGVEWDQLIWKVPLSVLFLWARQDQYCLNDNVITLGDKEMIDSLEKRKARYGN